MRKLIFTTFISLLLFIAIASSHGDVETRTMDEIMEEMMMGQGLTSVDKIDCSKVSTLDFEDLGEAVMERMAGDHELHERMDAMMGGEGSESLRQMHTIMGENWLGCGDGFGMMGGMMMPAMMNMMGNYYPGYYTSYNTVLIFGIIGWVLFIVLLVVFIINKGMFQIKKRRK